jgi:hypothetical protein
MAGIAILIHTRQDKMVGIYCDQPAKIPEVEPQENSKYISDPRNLAFLAPAGLGQQQRHTTTPLGRRHPWSRGAAELTFCGPSGGEVIAANQAGGQTPQQDAAGCTPVHGILASLEWNSVSFISFSTLVLCEVGLRIEARSLDRFIRQTAAPQIGKMVRMERPALQGFTDRPVFAAIWNLW